MSTDPRSELSVVTYLAFLGALMAFGIDAALPAFEQLDAEFGMNARGLSPAITGTAFLVGAAAGQFVWGLLADRFGRSPSLLAGSALLALGAAASAFAPTLGVLLVARAVWGFGAAALVLLRFAIARDLYSGDQMARVVSTFSAIFLLGPIFSPIAAEGILIYGDWRTVFATGVILALVALVWTARFGETLAPEHRRELRIGPIVDALRTILRTPVTLWILIAQAFFAGAFFIWLGSAQPVIDRIYDRDSQFTIFFGVSGAAMAFSLLINKRLIERVGVRTLVLRAAIGYVLVSVIGLGIALAAGGVPSVWLWFGWAVAANIFSIVIGPMSISLALEPMADQAGTTSSLLGVGQLGVGALLAAIFDAQVGDTVTPMVLGTLVYATIGLAALVVGLRSHLDSSGQPQMTTL